NGRTIRCCEEGRPTGLRYADSGNVVALVRPHQTDLACGSRRGRQERNTAATPAELAPVGVRASIVALKPGNAGRAKGRRKVEAGGLDRWNNDRRQCHWLNKSETFRTCGSGRNLRSGPNAC